VSDKLICSDDGLECIYPKQQEKIWWNCPKIQELLEKMKEADEDGKEQNQ
jgi:hypothetical protein